MNVWFFQLLGNNAINFEHILIKKIIFRIFYFFIQTINRYSNLIFVKESDTLDPNYKESICRITVTMNQTRNVIDIFHTIIIKYRTNIQKKLRIFLAII